MGEVQSNQVSLDVLKGIGKGAFNYLKELYEKGASSKEASTAKCEPYTPITAPQDQASISWGGLLLGGVGSSCGDTYTPPVTETDKCDRGKLDALPWEWVAEQYITEKELITPEDIQDLKNTGKYEALLKDVGEIFKKANDDEVFPYKEEVTAHDRLENCHEGWGNVGGKILGALYRIITLNIHSALDEDYDLYSEPDAIKAVINKYVGVEEEDELADAQDKLKTALAQLKEIQGEEYFEKCPDELQAALNNVIGRAEALVETDDRAKLDKIEGLTNELNINDKTKKGTIAYYRENVNPDNCKKKIDPAKLLAKAKKRLKSARTKLIRIRNSGCLKDCEPEPKYKTMLSRAFTNIKELLEISDPEDRGRIKRKTRHLTSGDEAKAGSIAYFNEKCKEIKALDAAKVELKSALGKLGTIKARECFNDCPEALQKAVKKAHGEAVTKVKKLLEICDPAKTKKIKDGTQALNRTYASYDNRVVPEKCEKGPTPEQLLAAARNSLNPLIAGLKNIPTTNCPEALKGELRNAIKAAEAIGGRNDRGAINTRTALLKDDKTKKGSIAYYKNRVNKECKKREKMITRTTSMEPRCEGAARKKPAKHDKPNGPCYKEAIKTCRDLDDKQFRGICENGVENKKWSAHYVKDEYGEE